MSRKDSASKRLARTIAHAKRARELRTNLGNAGERDFDRDLDLDDQNKRANLAHFALQIDDGEWWSSSTREAFDTFGLDPKNPFHWRNLLIYFADAHFRDRGEPGRPRGWTDETLCQLLFDFAALKQAHQNKRDTEICLLLKNDKQKEFGGRYNEIDAKTIRRMLQDARKPDRNSILAMALDTLVSDWLPRLRTKVEPGRWTQDHEKMICDGILQILIHPERLAAAEADGAVRKADRQKLLAASLVAGLMALELAREKGT